jgi:hypothetical protein
VTAKISASHVLEKDKARFQLVSDPQRPIPVIGSNNAIFKQVFDDFHPAECCDLLSVIERCGFLERYGYAAAKDILIWHRKAAEA